MGNLAITFREAGKLQEAERFEQQVLKVQTQESGSSHPDTIKAMANLAITLRQAGRLEEAEDLGKQVLKALTQVFGSSHPDTIRAMNNLAITLEKLKSCNKQRAFSSKS
ncbi:hypothetical protein C0989_008961 [Termitomyces sp. Mn162]|nr:hypothetical protein C0989_008961 [Termitomyces sp. Mn162]